MDEQVKPEKKKKGDDPSETAGNQTPGEKPEKTFEIKGVQPGLIWWKQEEIDLRECDQPRLKELFEQGLEYIKEV